MKQTERKIKEDKCVFYIFAKNNNNTTNNNNYNMK